MSTERWERTKHILEEALRLASEPAEQTATCAPRNHSSLRMKRGSQFLAAAPDILN